MTLTVTSKPRLTFDELREYKHLITGAMDAYGGSFVSSIAQAARRADPSNLYRLFQAFPDLFADYGPGTRFFADAKRAYES